MNFDGFDFDDNIKQTFNTLDIQGRVPHAVVIESRDSEKAMSLAVFMSMYAVCTAPIKPCCHCEQCHKARNKAHPDIKYVELPKDRKQNSIEQMREIIKDSIIKPNDSNAKVYIFPFADTRLSEIVQNSFLKLLEEPPQNVYFILLCENSKKLLTTILSRASVFRLKTKDVFSEDAVEGARKIIKGILSAKEYELMQALYALSDKSLADEILLAVKLFLRDGMAKSIGADAVFDEECAGELARRFTRAKLISMIELTENAKLKIPKHININLLTTWLCGEYRRISWQR